MGKEQKNQEKENNTKNKKRKISVKRKNKMKTKRERKQARSPSLAGHHKSAYWAEEKNTAQPRPCVGLFCNSITTVFKRPEQDMDQ